MRFAETTLPGVLRIALESAADERGDFARLHCEREFAQQGLAGHVVQTSLSRTARRGTVRGLHFQWPPSREAKIVRCTLGRIFDVVVDLRPGSPQFARHFAIELDARDRAGVYIPPGCAHGFQTLADGCEVLYQMTDFQSPALAAGVRWDDPVLGIDWPLPSAAIHERDARYADFDPARFVEQLRAHGAWDAP